MADAEMGFFSKIATSARQEFACWRFAGEAGLVGPARRFSVGPGYYAVIDGAAGASRPLVRFLARDFTEALERFERIRWNFVTAEILSQAGAEPHRIVDLVRKSTNEGDEVSLGLARYVESRSIGAVEPEGVRS